MMYSVEWKCRGRNRGRARESAQLAQSHRQETRTDASVDMVELGQRVWLWNVLRNRANKTCC